MPVYKYRRAEDIPSLERSSEAELATRIRRLWRRAFLLSPPSFRRGVIRFRTIEEANADRLRATRERMRRTARQRPAT